MSMKRSRGVVALISLLVISAVLLAMGIAIARVGRNEVVLARIFADGEIAFNVADACVEEGLSRLKDSSLYTGGTFALDDGTCSVAVTNLGGNDRLIRGTGSYQRATRIVEANVTLSTNGQGNVVKAAINTWKEGD